MTTQSSGNSYGTEMGSRLLVASFSGGQATSVISGSPSQGRGPKACLRHPITRSWKVKNLASALPCPSASHNSQTKGAEVGHGSTHSTYDNTSFHQSLRGQILAASHSNLGPSEAPAPESLNPLLPWPRATPRLISLVGNYACVTKVHVCRL